MDRPRIAITTCSQRDDYVLDDDPVLARAFESAGCEAPILDWNDPAADWSGFDAVLIRSTWDYFERRAEFEAWLECVDRESLLLNPLETVRTNLDKRYLLDLERAGVPIVPTELIEPAEPNPRSERRTPRAIAAARGWERVAIKPLLAGAARGLLVADGDDPAIDAHADALLGSGPALVQRFIPSVTEHGELSVVLIEGEAVCAVRKTPRPGDLRVQVEHGGVYELVEPSPTAIEVAQRTLACFPGEPLYARIDLLDPDDERPLVIEAELVEPELFFRMTESCTARFVDAVLARIATPARP